MTTAAFPTDLSANVERPAGDRPPLSRDDGRQAPERPWLGSAVSEVQFWKTRALRAEAALAEVLRANRGGA
jgi:hypothetical protein